MAAPAAAAPPPDRTAVIAAGSPAFAWDGQAAQAAAPQQSVQGFDPERCSKSAGYYCDLTLVRLDAMEGTTATLEFAIFDFSVPVADFDLSIFHSDASGAPGDFIVNGGNLSAAGMEETVRIDAEPGWYLATVSYYFSPGASYKGTVTGTDITPPPPPPAAPGPGEPASPTAAGPLPLRAGSGGSARAANRRRSLPLRVHAGSRITGLGLALRDGRGRLIARGRAAELAPGPGTVRLRVRRPLRRGRYRLHAAGSVDGVRRSVTRRIKVRR